MKETEEDNFIDKFEYEPDITFKFKIEICHSCIAKVHVDIYADDEKAGYAELLMVNMFTVHELDINLWDMFDSFSFKYMEYVDLLFEPNGDIKESIGKEFDMYEDWCPNWWLTGFGIGFSFVVYPKYRGNRIAEKLNFELCTLFKFDFIVVKPFPLQFEAFRENEGKKRKREIGFDEKKMPFEKAREKLFSYYEKCGMVRLEGAPDYMFLIPERSTKLIHRNSDRIDF